ncbi:uncharacterized protein [Anabrus simplex]|uniref:uncharacterized protein isoform X3 n=1 Tax=Anabrus simplex TaxID=316456 RepID=UPI0035A26709
MEEPVFIKCEPGYVSGTSELNNADHDVKQPTEKKMDVKTEPEDVFCKPFIKEEIEIQEEDSQWNPREEIEDDANTVGMAGEDETTGSRSIPVIVLTPTKHPNKKEGHED